MRIAVTRKNRDKGIAGETVTNGVTADLWYSKLLAIPNTIS